MIYDNLGRPIVKAAEARSPERRVRYKDRLATLWATYPAAGLKPATLASILKEADVGSVARQAELAADIEEKDPYLAGLMQTRKLAVQNLDREILPAGESAPAKRAAELARELTAHLDWEQIVLDAMDALFKGFSVQEILWDVTDKRVYIAGLEYIDPKNVTFATRQKPWWDDIPKILTEQERTYGEEPPPFKILYHRYRARSGAAQRAGLVRTVAWLYLFKNYSMKDWMSFIELFAMPLRIGKYPPGASDSDKAALKSALESLGTDAAGIMSEATHIEFPEAQKYGSVQTYEKFLNYLNNQQAYAVTGQTLTSSSGSGAGSYALGKVHEGVRQDLVEADSRALEKTINEQLIRPLIGFNLGWDAPMPKLKIRCEPPEDLKSAAETHKVLVELGMPLSQEYISERFKVPMLKDGDTPLVTANRPKGTEARDQAVQPAKRRVGENTITAKAGAPGATEESKLQAALDALVAEASERDDSEAVLAPLFDLVRTGASYDEIEGLLYDLHSPMGENGNRETLQRALFTARLAGMLSVEAEAKTPPRAEPNGGSGD